MVEERVGVAPLGLEFRKGYTVEQWINYIANAELVVTDSFHAVCFSIIFNKPFVYLLKMWNYTQDWKVFFNIIKSMRWL